MPIPVIISVIIYLIFAVSYSIYFAKPKNKSRKKKWEVRQYLIFINKFEELCKKGFFIALYILSIWVIIRQLNINNLFLEFFLHLSKVIVLFYCFPNLYFSYFNYFPIFKSSHQFNEFRKTVKIIIIAIIALGFASLTIGDKPRNDPLTENEKKELLEKAKEITESLEKSD